MIIIKAPRLSLGAFLYRFTFRTQFYKMNDSFDQIPDRPADLEKYIAEKEAAANVKPGTAANIHWHNSNAPSQTDTAIVYLHGFRASHPEGDPVHRQVAKACGCNLFLSRMQEHGIQSSYPLLNLTEQKLITSARFAFEIGKKIGKKVVLMGTSTGGSLALYLAAQKKLKEQISALVLYSPLIQFYGITNQLLTHAPIRKLMSIIPGRRYLLKTTNATKAEKRIWNNKYALGGALALGTFIQNNMTKSLFSSINCPTFVGYYYKNKKQQDKVISVPALKKMSQQLQTDNVHIRNFPDAQNHVICSSLVSKSANRVSSKTIQFLKNLDCHNTSTTETS
ncbi:Pimeloyl-ACP methyl ester carboxylesterase [Fodinibius salinus]|uniref:Pimeloyl-ACP methyl ester carboxylesterase n=1 Tax=Fodinibius salinus TaxID=860790 RepID=A0A5D3YHM5_9BACT|nr:alpha/beta hydrolase [Fodinibius salinus]TYP93394.1 Pimeloyl-ACP methyl ester carboxylesterase [Fodinibius salinus]